MNDPFKLLTHTSLDIVSFYEIIINNKNYNINKYGKIITIQQKTIWMTWRFEKKNKKIKKNLLKKNFI